MVTDIKNLKKQLAEETAGYSAEKSLKRLVEQFGDKIALATSFGAEDQVLTDMLCKTSKNPVIFTLDPGRLPEETYEVMEATRKKYGIEIEILFPEHKKVEEMVEQLMIAIEQGLVGIPREPKTEVLIDELKAFEYEVLPSGRVRYQAPSGLHDDCVISFGLAIMGIRHNLYHKPKKVEPVKKEGTWKDIHDKVKRMNHLARRPQNKMFSQTQLWEYVNAGR